MLSSEIFMKEFQSIQQEYDTEYKLKEELREIIKEIEQVAREILLVVQNIYSADGLTKIPEICEKARGMFPGVHAKYSALQDKVPKDQYYRYNDLWRFTTQRLVFIASYIVFLESNTLLKREEAAKFLGICVHATEGFHLDLDDLISGWIQVADELTRLAVCCATFDNHKLPYLIWRFVTELENNCSILSSKGESLRKRMDGLKFNSKRVADIVYDLSIRGLLKSSDIASFSS